jgi:hypothetical protein
MAEVSIASGFGLLHGRAHLHAVVPMEGIAFNDLGIDALSTKDVLKAAHYRGGTGPRRSCDGNYRMFH